MTAKEFCGLFGMTICEMGEFLRMTEQEINEIAQGHCAKPDEKKHSAMLDLRSLAAQKYLEEEREVTERYTARLEAASIFEVN